MFSLLILSAVGESPDADVAAARRAISQACAEKLDQESHLEETRSKACTGEGLMFERIPFDSDRRLLHRHALSQEATTPAVADFGARAGAGQQTARRDTSPGDRNRRFAEDGYDDFPDFVELIVRPGEMGKTIVNRCGIETGFVADGHRCRRGVGSSCRTF